MNRIVPAWGILRQYIVRHLHSFIYLGALPAWGARNKSRYAAKSAGATVNAECGTGHKCALVTRQIGGERRDIFGAAKPAHWMPGDKGLIGRVGIGKLGDARFQGR